MTTTIQKWGNSFAVRIPRELVRRLALRAGSGVIVCEERDAIMIRRQEPRASPVGKNDWKRYLIPGGRGRRKENVSGRIDAMVYGASR